MAEPFKLPGSSYDELAKIIAAYSSIPGEASPSDVGKLVGVDQTTISRNNGFLAAVGLIDELKGGKKTATDLGRDLGRALDHNLSDRVQEFWRAVVGRSDFLTSLVSAVRIRNGMDPASFISHVGYSAGLPRAGRTSTGGRTVLAILVAAGVVQSADGKIVAVSQIEVQSLESLGTPQRTSGELKRDQIPPDLTQASSSQVGLIVHVNLNVTSAELDGLGARLRAELESLRGERASEEEDDSEPS
jgi:hypothetical protein